MIYQTGYQKPTAAELRAVKAVADDSFCTNAPSHVVPPCPAPWKFDRLTSIALRLKTVEPHTDDWSGSFSNKPRSYAAVFWLMHVNDNDCIYLQIGNTAERLRAGDFVVFDDRIMHSVVARHTWIGCAYQARKA
jgi:hypothetical protein